MENIEIVERILWFTVDPRTVCRLACVSKTFLAASNSTVVWQRFLPSVGYDLDHYAALLSDAGVIHPNTPVNLKDIWLHFCRQPLTLDGGSKKCWMDPTSGSLSYLISPQNLDIIWIHDNRYWTWVQNCPGAWFEYVARLNYVWWFKIEGNIQQIFAPGSYVLLFRMQVHNPRWWRGYMIKLGSRIEASSTFESEIDADFSLAFPKSIYPPPNNNFNNDQQEVWVECEVGRFNIEEEERNVPINIQVYMRETGDVDFVKRGICLDGVIIRSLNTI